MDTPQTLNQFALLLVFSVVLIGVGFPLLLRLVPPNRIYGWRSDAALGNPEIWFPVNRVAGLWVLLTGLLLAIVSVSTYLAEFASYPASCLSGAAFFLGIMGMAIHGGITERRLTGTKPGPSVWWIGSLLFLVFIGLLLSGLIMGLLV